MNLYPYNSPIILTDTIFLAYGGMTGSSISSQRSASYFIAEQTVSDDLETLLLPTTVTGTFLYRPFNNYILDYGYINQIIQVDFLDAEEQSFFTVDTPSIYSYLLDAERGYIGFNTFCGGCTPYKIQAVYNAGLPSGTSYHPNVLLALTTMAQIFLNEIIGYGNEAPGDVGIESFRNQQYSEQRKFLLRTTFGESSKAQFVWRLLSPLRRYRQVGL